MIKLLNRSIRIFLVLTFLAIQLDGTPALERKPKAPIQAGQSVLFPSNFAKLNPQNISVPSSLGLLRASHEGKNHKLVIHIQDAHAHPEAQEKIARLIEGWVQRYWIGLVGVEGAQGLLDTSAYRLLPKRRLTEKTAHFLLKEAFLTGPEYLAIAGHCPFHLYGVEDLKLHQKNLNQFRNAVRAGEKAREALLGWRTNLQSFKEKIYSSELLAWDEALQKACPDGQWGAQGYFEILQKSAEKLGVSLEKVPALASFFEAQALGKNFDPERVSQERDELLQKLAAKLTPDELQSFIRQTLEMRLGKISSVEFDLMLKNILESRLGQAAWSDAPHFKIYLQYVERMAQAQRSDLLLEGERLEGLIEGALIKNESEQRLIYLSKSLAFLGRFFSLSLGASEWEEYHQNTSRFSLDSILAQLKSFGVDLGKETLEPAWKEAMTEAQAFYETAQERDAVMVNRLLERMDEEKTPIAILVTGGFHTQGMMKELESRGVSYRVMTPQLKEVPSEEHYLDLMMGKDFFLQNFMNEIFKQEPSSSKIFRPSSLPDASFYGMFLMIRALFGNETLALRIPGPDGTCLVTKTEENLSDGKKRIQFWIRMEGTLARQCLASVIVSEEKGVENLERWESPLSILDLRVFLMRARLEKEGRLKTATADEQALNRADSKQLNGVTLSDGTTATRHSLGPRPTEEELEAVDLSQAKAMNRASLHPILGSLSNVQAQAPCELEIERLIHDIQKGETTLQGKTYAIEFYYQRTPYANGLPALTKREGHTIRIYLSGDFNIPAEGLLSADQITAFIGFFHEVHEEMTLRRKYSSLTLQNRHQMAVYDEARLMHFFQYRLPENLRHPVLSPLSILEIKRALDAQIGALYRETADKDRGSHAVLPDDYSRLGAIYLGAVGLWVQAEQTLRTEETLDRVREGLNREEAVEILKALGQTEGFARRFVRSTNLRIFALWNPDQDIRLEYAQSLVKSGEALMGQVSGHPVLGKHIVLPSRSVDAKEGHAAVASAGVAVNSDHFNEIRRRWGNPDLSNVPADAEVDEFEIEVTLPDGSHRVLDILRDTSTSTKKTIGKHIEKFGEGIQQVEVWTEDIEAASRDILAVIDSGDSSLIRVSPAPHEGANGSQVFFVWVVLEGGKKVLLELVERPKALTAPSGENFANDRGQMLGIIRSGRAPVHLLIPRVVRADAEVEGALYQRVHGISTEDQIRHDAGEVEILANALNLTINEVRSVGRLHETRHAVIASIENYMLGFIWSFRDELTKACGSEDRLKQFLKAFYLTFPEPDLYRVLADSDIFSRDLDAMAAIFLRGENPSPKSDRERKILEILERMLSNDSLLNTAVEELLIRFIESRNTVLRNHPMLAAESFYNHDLFKRLGQVIEEHVQSYSENALPYLNGKRPASISALLFAGERDASIEDQLHFYEAKGFQFEDVDLRAISQSEKPLLQYQGKGKVRLNEQKGLLEAGTDVEAVTAQVQDSLGQITRSVQKGPASVTLQGEEAVLTTTQTNGSLAGVQSQGVPLNDPVLMRFLSALGLETLSLRYTLLVRPRTVVRLINWLALAFQISSRDPFLSRLANARKLFDERLEAKKSENPKAIHVKAITLEQIEKDFLDAGTKDMIKRELESGIHYCILADENLGDEAIRERLMASNFDLSSLASGNAFVIKVIQGKTLDMDRAVNQIKSTLQEKLGSQAVSDETFRAYVENPEDLQEQTSLVFAFHEGLNLQGRHAHFRYFNVREGVRLSETLMLLQGLFSASFAEVIRQMRNYILAHKDEFGLSEGELGDILRSNGNSLLLPPAATGNLVHQLNAERRATRIVEWNA